MPLTVAVAAAPAQTTPLFSQEVQPPGSKPPETREEWLRALDAFEGAFRTAVQKGNTTGLPLEAWRELESRWPEAVRDFPDLKGRKDEVEALLGLALKAPPAPSGPSDATHSRAAHGPTEEPIAVSLTSISRSLQANKTQAGSFLDQLFDLSDRYKEVPPVRAQAAQPSGTGPSWTRVEGLRKQAPGQPPSGPEQARGPPKPGILDRLHQRLAEDGTLFGAPAEFGRRFKILLEDSLRQYPSGADVLKKTAVRSPHVVIADLGNAEAEHHEWFEVIRFDRETILDSVAHADPNFKKEDFLHPAQLTKYLLDHPETMRKAARAQEANYVHELKHHEQSVRFGRDLLRYPSDIYPVEHEHESFLEASLYLLEKLERDPKLLSDSAPGLSADLGRLREYAKDPVSFRQDITATYRGEGLHGRPLDEIIGQVQKEIQEAQSGWRGLIPGYLWGLKRNLAHWQEEKKHYDTYFAAKQREWPKVSMRVNLLDAGHWAQGTPSFALSHLRQAHSVASSHGLLDDKIRTRVREIFGTLSASYAEKLSGLARAYAGGVNPGDLTPLQQSLNNIAAIRSAGSDFGTPLPEAFEKSAQELGWALYRHNEKVLTGEAWDGAGTRVVHFTPKGEAIITGFPPAWEVPRDARLRVLEGNAYLARHYLNRPDLAGKLETRLKVLRNGKK